MAEGDTSYSIWLIPDANDSFHTRIATEISYWAPKKNGPLFPPHVTLIGGIKGSREDVVSKTQALSLQLRVCPVRCSIDSNSAIYTACPVMLALEAGLYTLEHTSHMQVAPN